MVIWAVMQEWHRIAKGRGVMVIGVWLEQALD